MQYETKLLGYLGEEEKQASFDYFEDDRRAFIVMADSMGDHVGGAEASKLTVDHFIKVTRQKASNAPDEIFLKAAYGSNDIIKASVKLNAELLGMGSSPPY